MQRENPVLSICALALLVCSGCAGGEFKYPSPDPSAIAGRFILKSGQFPAGSRAYEADFGTITVPENRNNPASRLIHIPLIRVHSQAKAPLEPVFGLAGGPGMSNMKWMPPDSLLVDHDFVMVGYRGVDGSSVLDCPDVVVAMKAGDELLADQTLRRIAEAWRRSAQRLKQSGVDIDGYSMAEVVEDVELARTILGYERINLISESYGTRVAYVYALAHPASIRRSVMISVNPPGHFVWEPRTVDAQVQYYDRLWSKDAEMSRRGPGPSASMRKVLTAMPRSWFLFPINEGKVRTVTFALLFNRHTAAMVFDAFGAAEEGDASGLALMSTAYDFVIPSMFTWGDLASKAISADFDTVRHYAEDMVPPDALLGSPLGKLLWGPLTYARWPVTPLPTRYRTLQHSDVETLLLSGSVDFSTPAEFATNELLPYLRNGRQIILSEMGHVADVWSARPGATVRIIAAFFRTGIPDTSAVSYVPMDFAVAWGFPRLAKIALGAALVVLAALIGGIVWWVRS